MAELSSYLWIGLRAKIFPWILRLTVKLQRHKQNRCHNKTITNQLWFSLLSLSALTFFLHTHPILPLFYYTPYLEYTVIHIQPSSTLTKANLIMYIGQDFNNVLFFDFEYFTFCKWNTQSCDFSAPSILLELFDGHDITHIQFVIVWTSCNKDWCTCPNDLKITMSILCIW